MSVRISLSLEASEVFLSLHMIFSLERAAVAGAILERISGFDPSLEMIAPRYLKLSTSSSLWPFILISLWKPLELFVITFVLSGPISILYPVVVLSRRSIRTPASSFSAFTTMSSAKRKLVMSRPPMLTLPSWSSKASYMILSRKMLKRVGESRHPCRTPTVVLNHSPVLPLNRIVASVEIRTEWSSNIADSFSVLWNTTYVTISELELYILSVSNSKLNFN